MPGTVWKQALGPIFDIFAIFYPIRVLDDFVEEVISYPPDVALMKIIIAKAYGDINISGRLILSNKVNKDNFSF
jgi:hypothetical protein